MLWNGHTDNYGEIGKTISPFFPQSVGGRHTWLLLQRLPINLLSLQCLVKNLILVWYIRHMIITWARANTRDLENPMRDNIFWSQIFKMFYHIWGLRLRCPCVSMINRKIFHSQNPCRSINNLVTIHPVTLGKILETIEIWWALVTDQRMFLTYVK